MKTTPHFLSSAVAVIISVGTVNAAKWQRLPTMDADPVESTTPYRHLDSPGARVLSSKGIDNAGAFVSHDPTVRAKLHAGDSEIVIDLDHQEVIHGLAFANDSMEGSVRIEASTNRNEWSNVIQEGQIPEGSGSPRALTFLGEGQTAFTALDRFPNLEIAGILCRYIKVHFQLTRGGSLRNFEVYGSDTDKDFKLVPTDSEGPSSEVNLADGIGGARLIYVHPSPLNHDWHSTHRKGHQPLEFPESNERFRTAIYDLGEVRKVRSFGSVHSPRPVRMQVYLFDSLEEKEDWRYRMSFDPAIFDRIKPDAVVEDKDGTGSIKVDLDGTRPTRYVALRWEPDFNPPAFTVGGVLIASRGWMVVPTGAGGGTGTPVTGGPPPSYYVGGMSPFGFGTSGYAGGGGSLPTTPTTTRITQTIYTEAPVASP